MLLKDHSIPKTTSGKIRRSETKSRWQAGSLPTLYCSRTPTELMAQFMEMQEDFKEPALCSLPPDSELKVDLSSEAEVSAQVTQVLSSVLGHRVELHDSLFSHGLTSLQAAQAVSVLEARLDISLTVSDFLASSVCPIEFHFLYPLIFLLCTPLSSRPFKAWYL